MQRETLCYCGNTVTHEFPESVDISRDSDMLSSILQGTFLEITCESCGEVLKPDFPLRLERVPSPLGPLSIDYFPEPDRVRFLSGKIESSADRVVIGYPELREKILIFTSQLDDRAVEILKFLLWEKAETTESLTILLEKCHEEELTFYIYGLKEKEVGVTPVPMQIYEKINHTLGERMQNEVYAKISETPYVSINKISLDEGEEA